MENINVAALIEACDRLQAKTITAKGCMHSSVRCFDACMRAFDNSRLSAQAITFNVYFNAPVLKPGTATIYRDGRIEMRTQAAI